MHLKTMQTGFKEKFFYLQHYKKIFIYFALALITLAVYLQVLNHNFIIYDDYQYVRDNPQVKNGITLSGIIWAFKTDTLANWHPITWLSHMLDVQLFGLQVGAHHITSVFFHILNSFLLLFLLQKTTQKIWPSFFVAMLFAIHPLHVESVAWIAERKDMLSTFFGLLAIIAYRQYSLTKERAHYFLVLLFFLLSLLSKPMLVTLPFLLLLLDYWPLKRFPRYDPDKLADITNILIQYKEFLIEKIPLFMLAIMSSAITMYVQQTSIRNETSVIENLTNAIHSYGFYIYKLIIPLNLALPYPDSGPPPLVFVLLSAALLLSITFYAVKQISNQPYIFCGWFWFLGALVPVIGFVKIGHAAYADRYSYFPSIGFFILITWTADHFLAKKKLNKNITTMVSACIIFILASLSYQQVAHWKNTNTLFTHAASITKNNHIAHVLIGKDFQDKGMMESALKQYDEAIMMFPKNDLAYYHLADIYVNKGDYEKSIEYLEKYLELRPDSFEMRIKTAKVYEIIGDTKKAIYHYKYATELAPLRPLNNYKLAVLFEREGNFEEALHFYMKEILVNPSYAPAYNSIGNYYLNKGQLNLAITNYTKAIAYHKSYAQAHNNLGIAFAQAGQLDRATQHFKAALSIDPTYQKAQENLERATIEIRNLPADN
jgi:tetratricopeptide (TPR) repeat protein